MKKYFLKSALAAVFATTMFGGVVTAQEYNWRLTHFAPKTSAFYTVMTQPFLDRIKGFMGDEIKITAFGGGELAPGFRAYEAVTDGLADMAHTTPLYIVNKDLTNTFIGGHPGGMGADALTYWLYEAGGQELATKFKRETMGLHTLVAACVTAEIWHSHKPLTEIEDLKGLRFRTAGAWAAILKNRFEAAPVTVAGSELYTLFERKGVDAMEWSGVSENLKMGFDKIGEYITVPAPHGNGGCFELVWRVETWDALPEDVRRKITAIAKLATMDSILIWKRDEIKAFAKLGNNDKVTVVKASDELVKAVSDAGRDYVYEKIAAQGDNNGWLKKMADSYYSAMGEYAAAKMLLAK